MSFQLESKKRFLGWIQTKGNSLPIHHHCHGLEERWISAGCSKCLHLCYANASCHSQSLDLSGACNFFSFAGYLVWWSGTLWLLFEKICVQKQVWNDVCWTQSDWYTESHICNSPNNFFYYSENWQCVQLSILMKTRVNLLNFTGHCQEFIIWNSCCSEISLWIRGNALFWHHEHFHLIYLMTSPN